MDDMKEVIRALGRIEGKLTQISTEKIPERVSALERWRATMSGSIRVLWITLCVLASALVVALKIGVAAYGK